MFCRRVAQDGFCRVCSGSHKDLHVSPLKAKRATELMPEQTDSQEFSPSLPCLETRANFDQICRFAFRIVDVNCNGALDKEEVSEVQPLYA